MIDLEVLLQAGGSLWRDVPPEDTAKVMDAVFGLVSRLGEDASLHRSCKVRVVLSCASLLCGCVFAFLVSSRLVQAVASGKYLSEVALRQPRMPSACNCHNPSRSFKKLRCAVAKLGKMARADNVEAVLAEIPVKRQKTDRQELLALEDQQLDEPGPAPIHDEVPAQAGMPGQVAAPVQAGDDRALVPAHQGYRRKAGDLPTIHQICQVVQRALQIPAGQPRQKIIRREFPGVMRSDILSKWISRYFRQQLYKVPEELARKWHVLPTWYCVQKGMPHQIKGRKTVAGVPKEAWRSSPSQCMLTCACLLCMCKLDGAGREACRPGKCGVCHGFDNGHEKSRRCPIQTSHQKNPGDCNEAVQDTHARASHENPRSQQQGVGEFHRGP